MAKYTKHFRRLSIERSREMVRWRKAHGLTQPEFAQALGRSLRAIMYLETGKRGCQYGTYARFEALKKRYEEAKA
jgi:transcriptional regulator with XRE-family HTH domain